MAKQVRISDEEVLAIVTPDIDRARAHHKDLSDERYRAYKLYRFQKLGNERQGFSQVVDSVAWNTVEWLIPNISAVFQGDFFNLVSDNEQRAERLKKYIRYLFFRKQNGKRLIRDFVRTGCTYHYGIFKVYHKEDYDEEAGKIDSMSAEEFAALSARPDIEITKYDEVTIQLENPQRPLDFMVNGPATLGQVYQPFITQIMYEKVKFVKRTVKYAGPWTDIVPPWELFFIPGYPSLEETPFVAHRVKRTLDYVLRRERDGTYKKGTYEKVKHKIDNRRDDDGGDFTGELEQLYWVEGLTAPDENFVDSDWSNELRLKQNEVWIWECYLNLDIDKDGLLEPCVVTICEDVVCQEPQENPYGCVPFILGYAHKEPFKLEGFPIPLMVEEEQKEQTNIRRLIVDSAAESSYRTVITSNPHMAQQWADRVMGDAIIGQPDSFKEVTANAPSQFVLRAYELGNSRLENKTGITSYNQGLNSDSLNKTATGINMIMSASQMRMRFAYTESFAEAFEELIRRYIKIIQMYPPKDAIRVVGDELEIMPDDLRGEFDIEIDVGVGPQARQATAQQLDAHIELLVKVLLPGGFAKPVHLIKTVLKKYELLGIKAQDLMPTPDDMERMEAQANAMAQDQDFVGQLDNGIRQMMQQGLPPDAIGNNLMNAVAEYMSAREQQQPGGPAPAGGAGGNMLPPKQQPGPQGMPGMV